jgi:hypothetical protein
MSTYILSPHTSNNFAVLQSALADFPLIAEEQRVKYVYARNDGDVVARSEMGATLLVPAATVQFIYLCATVPADDPALLQFLNALDAYELYTIDTQPFSTYWL